MTEENNENNENIPNITENKEKLTKKQQFKQVLFFALFSIGAAGIQIGSFSLLNELCQLSYWPAYLISLLLSIIFNFTFNRKFTFCSKNSIPFAFSKVILYYLIFTPVSTLLGQYCTDLGCNEYVVLICTMLINFVTEFLYQKFFVFAKNKKQAQPLAD